MEEKKQPQLSQQLGQPQQPQVLLIGAGVIDVLACPAGPEVFVTGSSPAQQIQMATGGDALNEATILAKMGIRTQLCMLTGDDKAGEILREHCKNTGILLDDSLTRPGLATGVNIVLITADGERHFITNPKSSLRALTLSDIAMPFPESVKIVCFASIFVFPHLKAEELAVIFAQVKAQGKILCADMTKKKNQETVAEMAPALRFVDYLIPNAEEAMLLTGENTVEAAGIALLAAGVKHVVIKNGKKGCVLFYDDQIEYVRTEASEHLVDTTGAGDSFSAGFISALSRGMDLRSCAQKGNECGRKAVEVVGATAWI